MQDREEEFRRALARAQRDRIAIIARDWRDAEGHRVIGVSSSKNADEWYLVKVLDDCLTCNCPASEHHPYVICKHRALARQLLLSERRLPVMDSRPISLFK